VKKEKKINFEITDIDFEDFENLKNYGENT